MKHTSTGSNRAFPWAALVTWLALPGILLWLTYLTNNSLPFWAHQLYYLPLGSWMGRPFFEPDSEVMFWAKPAGRWATGILYLSVVAAITYCLDRFRRWPNTMWRHVAAFAAVIALSNVAANYFDVYPRSYPEFSYGRVDALADLCALWFALIGGWISGRYGFAIAAAMLYLAYSVLGMYFVINAFGVGLQQALAANALNTATSMGAAALGACVGVFLSSPRGRAPIPQKSAE
ncbi:hypothetical protein [uncultured Stenotrophomonas sp.]|uniref:hypothetical protein n=1 Tax=uncultured Stenotrophomonas sp. TaxID=165438 RepID=UPI0028EBE28C|nr:hypothetical protein [uncultured Stenotrophomonas sp.]